MNRVSSSARPRNRALTGRKPRQIQEIKPEDAYRVMVGFAHLAIRKLREAEGHKSKGIHAVYSGFNGAFRQQFGLSKEQGIAVTRTMQERGDLEVVPARGGVMLYLPGEKPARTERSADSVLAKILG